MEILKTFGLNPYLTIAQIVNFLILFYVLKKYLYPPLFKVFKKREELVKESIQKAEASEKALEKAKEQEKEVIKKARITSDEIIKEAREQSDSIVKQAETTAKERTDKMIQDAKSRIELETAQAQEELNTYVLELSMNLLRKTLSNVFSEKEQNEIVDKAMKEIQKLPN